MAEKKHFTIGLTIFGAVLAAVIAGWQNECSEISSSYEKFISLSKTVLSDSQNNRPSGKIPEASKKTRLELAEAMYSLQGLIDGEQNAADIIESTNTIRHSAETAEVDNFEAGHDTLKVAMEKFLDRCE